MGCGASAPVNEERPTIKPLTKVDPSTSDELASLREISEKAELTAVWSQIEQWVKPSSNPRDEDDEL